MALTKSLLLSLTIPEGYCEAKTWMIFSKIKNMRKYIRLDINQHFFMNNGIDLQYGICMHIRFCCTNLDELHDKNRMELDQKAMNLQRIDEETRRAIHVATKEFNKAQVNQYSLLEERKIRQTIVFQFQKNTFLQVRIYFLRKSSSIASLLYHRLCSQKVIYSTVLKTFRSKACFSLTRLTQR